MNDAKQPMSSASDPDTQMIAVLRSCGFDVRVQHRAAPEARPEVYGTIDNAVSLFKLAVAGADCIGKGESQRVQQPAAAVGLSIEMSQFLTDVTTAAGLLSYGRQDKGLAKRIGQAVFAMRTAPYRVATLAPPTSGEA